MNFACRDRRRCRIRAGNGGPLHRQIVRPHPGGAADDSPRVAVARGGAGDRRPRRGAPRRSRTTEPAFAGDSARCRGWSAGHRCRAVSAGRCHFPTEVASALGTSQPSVCRAWRALARSRRRPGSTDRSRRRDGRHAAAARIGTCPRTSVRGLCSRRQPRRHPGDLLAVLCRVRDFTAAETQLLEILAGRLAAELERSVLWARSRRPRKPSGRGTDSQWHRDRNQLVPPLLEGWQVSAASQVDARVLGDFHFWRVSEDSRAVPRDRRDARFGGLPRSSPPRCSAAHSRRRRCTTRTRVGFCNK